MAEKEWQVTKITGKEVTREKIKVKQEKIKDPPVKAKDKLDLVLEGIEDVKKKAERKQG